MTRQEWWFLLLLLINFIIALLYWILGWIFRSKQEGKIYFVMRALVMLLCPLVGPLFFFIGYLNFRFLMHRKVNLEDVVFSKERRRSLVHADEEREQNMVPLEEAIAVTDKENLRNYMLNVLRGNIRDSLSAISMALNSEDSETSHYAASVLRDELNDFRLNVQKIYGEIKREDALPEKETFEAQEVQPKQEPDEKRPEYDEEQLKYCELMLEYLNPVLEQNVFTGMEQASFAGMMDEVAEILYTYARWRMKPYFYEQTCLRLTECRNFEKAEIWGRRSMEEFNDKLSSYTCLLKLYFTMGEKEKFFEILNQLKNSHVIVDNETLELIRIFQ